MADKETHQAEATTEKDRVVQVVTSMHGEFHVLLASGRIFKREKNAKDTDPATKDRMLWTEISLAGLPL